jgi:hypothetical protein
VPIAKLGSIEEACFMLRLQQGRRQQPLIEKRDVISASLLKLLLDSIIGLLNSTGPTWWNGRFVRSLVVLRSQSCRGVACRHEPDSSVFPLTSSASPHR